MKKIINKIKEVAKKIITAIILIAIAPIAIVLWPVTLSLLCNAVIIGGWAFLSIFIHDLEFPELVTPWECFKDVMCETGKKIKAVFA